MIQIDFDKFKKVSGYDIEAFFIRFDDFLSDYYQSIISYYNGGNLVQDAFYELDYLLVQVKIIEPLFRINSNQYDTIDMWELLDLFSDIQIKLLTIKKSGKWMRSSRLNTNEVGVKIDRIQSQNETLEAMAESVGYADPQDDWATLAINNQITEEDYTLDGGNIVSITLQNNLNVGIDNIVDYTVGQNILGKDIKRKIAFIDNDLEVVEYKEAINQSFGIKISAKKNSIPEFPVYGINNDNEGTNVAAISYPTLFKDLLNLFKQDQRWDKVTLLDIARDVDSVKMKFEARTILKNSIITNINV